MLITRAPICILVLACTALPGCGKNIPPDVASLIEKADQLNDKCRGGSGDDPATMSACDARDTLIEQIRAKNYCYGTEQQIQAEKTWQECAPASAVATQAGRSKIDLTNLYGAWRCRNIKNDDRDYVEYDFDPKNQEFLAYGAIGSKNLAEPLIYGHFWMNGNQVSVRWEATKFVKNIPPLLDGLWHPAPKNEPMEYSTFATYEYTIVTHTQDKLIMKPTRRVFWDGIHSQDRATWPVESCTSIRATYPLTENVGEIPDYIRALQPNGNAPVSAAGQGSVPPSSSVQPPFAGNTAKDYEVITVRQPTASELVLVHKSSAREFLADGGTVTVASADLNGDGVPELIVFAHSSMWCGSGGCASKVLMTRSNGNITTYDNDCMYFGESGKIGVGSNGSGKFASMYPLNDDNTVAIMDKNGMPDTGKPIVCHLAQTQR